MKASFILSGLFAAVALASPLVARKEDGVTTGNPSVDTIKYVEGIAKKVGIDQIIDQASGKKVARAASPITTVKELTVKLTSAVNNIKTSTNKVQDIAKQVKAGKITKSQGSSQAAAQFKTVHFQLSTLLVEVLGAAGLNAKASDIDKVLTLVTVLLNEVLTAVKTIVLVTGLTPQLTSILHSVFNLLTEVLAGLVALLAGLLPGLIAALTPLLAALGTGVLAPLLTPLAALLASLTAGGGL